MHSSVHHLVYTTCLSLVFTSCIRSGFYSYSPDVKPSPGGVDAAVGGVLDAHTPDSTWDGGIGDVASDDAFVAEDADLPDAPSVDAVLDSPAADGFMDAMVADAAVAVFGDAAAVDTFVEDGSGQDGSGQDGSGQDGSGQDGGGFIVGQTKVSGGASHYVEIDVDWSRGLAFLGSMTDGVCFDIVDITDELNPQLLAQFGTSTVPATQANGCRGLQLYDGNSKLLIGSHDDQRGNGWVEAWEVTGTVGLGSFGPIDAFAAGHTRRVAAIDERGLEPVFHMSNRNGVRSYTLSSGTLAPLESWTDGGLEADAVMIADKYLLSGGWGAGAALQLLSRDDLSLEAEFAMDNGQSNTSWSAAVSQDGSKAFFGGWVSAFLSFEDGALPEVSLTQRIDNESVYRDAVFVEDAGTTFLYGVRSDAVLDVFDVSDIHHPRLVYQTPLLVAPEAYGVRVNTTTRRAVICTTSGDLIIVNIDKMTPVTAAGQYPTYLPSDLFYTSIAKLNPVHSYVFVDVDWERRLAYASSIESGICLDVIDFANPGSPTVIARLGTLAEVDFVTSCSMSRGLELFDGNTKLLVTSLSPGGIEVWNLGASPRDLLFSQETALAGMDARRVAHIEQTSPMMWRFYLSVRNGVRYYDYDVVGGTLTEVSRWTGVNSHNDATVVDRKYFVTAGWPDAEPISVIDIATMGPINTFNMNNGGTSGFWTAATSADQERVFVGGWVSAFLSYQPGDSEEITVTHRFDSSETAPYRDAVFVDHMGRTYLYALQNDLILDVIDATDIQQPVLKYRTEIPVGDSEAYSLQVNPESKEVALVTNEGDFICGSLYDMTPTTTQHPTFTPQ